jgi:hypothetical protein
MNWISLIVLAIALTACRLNHHEQMTPHYVYAPVDCSVPGGQVVLEGNYQGQNVYVQNPFANCTDTTIKFCTSEVVINDSISLPKDSLNMSCFRILLTAYDFHEGDKIRIVIKHYGDCTPKVLNPEVQ